MGFGPCYHMEEVDEKSRRSRSPCGCLRRREKWIGSRPTLGTMRRSTGPPPLSPGSWSHSILMRSSSSRFTTPGSWYASFSQTIYPLIQPTEDTPSDLLPFLAMVVAVVEKTGFGIPSMKDEIVAAYHRHTETVTGTIPPDQLLVFDVKEGWEPLCRFLGVSVPAKDFPKTNNTQDFWDSVQAG